MDYATLKVLIDAEPTNAARSDAEVLGWLQESVGTWQDIPWLDVAMWLVAQGIDRATLTTQATTGTAANKTAAQYVLDVITAGQPLQATDQRVRDTITASGLTAPQKAALVALATISAPRYRTAGWDGVSLQIVNTARSW